MRGITQMPYWRLFYHIVWSTKKREPLLREVWEQDLYKYLWGKSTALGCHPHAINGMEDHIHVAISIPPQQKISKIIGHLKGSSSHYINRELEPSYSFKWQASYGVISISESSLPQVIHYINQQKAHHREGSLRESLEDVF